MSTYVVGQEFLGGMGYFVMYAIIGATLCGIGLPLYWIVVVKNPPLSDLELTFQNWKGSDWYYNIQASPARQVETGFVRYVPGAAPPIA